MFGGLGGDQGGNRGAGGTKGCNKDYRIQNTEYRIQNTECRIQNTEYRIQNGCVCVC